MNRRRFNFSVTQLLLLTAFVALLAGLLTARWRVSEYRYLQALAYSPDGRYLVADYRGTDVQLWDFSQRSPSCRRLSLGEDTRLYPRKTCFRTPTRLVTFSYDYDSRLPTKVTQWDVVEDRLVKESRLPALDWFTVEVSHDWQEAIVMSYDGGTDFLQFWDLDKGTEFPKRGSRLELSGWAVAVDGRKVAIAVPQHRGEGTQVHVSDLDDDSQFQTLLFSERIHGLALSSDGRWLAVRLSRGGERIQVWDWETQRRKCSFQCLPGITVGVIRFSPDGTLLVGADNYGAVHVWDTEIDKKRAKLTLPNAIGSSPEWAAFAFSPDGQTLAVGNGEAIRLWDVRTQRLRTLRHTRRGELTAMFSGSLLLWSVVWGFVERRRKQKRLPSAPQKDMPPDGSEPKKLPLSLLTSMVLTVIAGIAAIGSSVFWLTHFTSSPLEQMLEVLAATRFAGAVVGVFAITRVVAFDLRRLTAANLLLLGSLLCCDLLTAPIALVAFVARWTKSARKYIMSQTASIS